MLQRCIKENKEETKESAYGKNILTIVPAALSLSPLVSQTSHATSLGNGLSP